MKTYCLYPAFLALLTSTALSAMPAAEPIGMVVSDGQFKVQDSNESGTATLFEGDNLETQGASTRVRLKDGVALELYAHSGIRIFSSHVLLLSGTVSVQASSAYQVDAGTYAVDARTPDTRVAVQLVGDSMIVAVPKGTVAVADSYGKSLASLSDGKTLKFTAPGAGVTLPQSHLLGVLTRSNDHFMIRDRYSNQVSELLGNVPTKDVDHLVAADGELISNNSKLPNVDHIVQLAKIVLSDAAVGAPCLADGVGGVATRIILDGVLSKVRDHFLVNGPDRKPYEVIGNVNDSQVGQKFHAPALVLNQHQAIAPAKQVVYTEARKLVVGASPCAGLAAAGAAVTSGVLLLPKDDNPVHGTPISF